LLVLDEPTAGLDPQSRRSLHALVREMQSEGRTVLLSTHDLEEAGQLCDHIGIIDGGRMVTVASPADLIGRSQAPARVIVRTVPPLATADVDALPEVVRAVFGDRGWVLETRAPNRLLADLARRAAEAEAELLDVELHRPTLEDVFIELTGHPWPGGAPEGLPG
jgi:ABC-2 type transport system ATP-binding protein